MKENYRVKLKSFQVIEKKSEDVETQFDIPSLGNFNLLISDNAQGKTRLFNIFNFFSRLFSEKTALVNANLMATMTFDAIDQKGDENIIYTIHIEPENGKNNYHEQITSNGRTIYSSREKVLYNETKNKNVENYFIPQNLPAILSISESDFITINLIRDFFQRFVFISANKTRDIVVDSESLTPDTNGTNVASVLNNWSKKYPEIFNEVINKLIECFPFIKKVYFTEKQIPKSILTKVLTIDEKNINFPITQENWSDGLYRMLHLLMVPKIPFSSNHKLLHPTLIFIDEIENGLDFKSLKFIINYLKDYSDDSQIMITSHSPLICDFVHPENWIVVRRNGATLKYLSPKFIEQDMEKQLDLFKHKHWEFYTKHISTSQNYMVE